MEPEKMISLALECGFTAAFPLDPKKLKFLPAVRDMCSADKCGSYGKSWSCPPACGTLEENAARAEKYACGILLQTTAELSDSFDYEAIAAGEKRHRESFEKLVSAMRPDFPDMFPMGAGGCRICKSCTYPDAPCRFPERMTSSMEACGLLVTDVCSDCGAPYYYGPGTLTFSACILYNVPAFKSRQNCVTPLEYDGKKAVKKLFSKPERLEAETHVMSALRKAGAAVPAEYGRGNDFVIYEYVEGQTLISQLEALDFSGAITDSLAAWLVLCSETLKETFGEPYILGDIHLANFIWNGKCVVGFDFEECTPGAFEDDIARLLVFIVTYTPMFSDYELSAAARLLNAVRRLRRLDDAALSDALDNSFSVIFRRRGLAPDYESIRRTKAALGL